MSQVQVSVEPLSAQERKLLSFSRIAHIILAVLMASPFPPLLVFGDFDSWGEIIFIGTILLLCLGLFIPFLMSTTATWKDYADGKKIVVRGRVDSVQRKFLSQGVSYTIRVGGQFTAGDPLRSGPPYLSDIKVGSTVEIAYLPKSRRTLSVTPV